jgi:hypothetical protein
VMCLKAYVNQIYEAVPRQVSVSSKKRSVNDSMCWQSLPKARNVVVCLRQGRQAVDLVGHRC